MSFGEVLLQSRASATALRETTATGESHMGTPFIVMAPFFHETESAGISNTRPVIMSTHTGRSSFSGMSSVTGVNESPESGRSPENQ